MGTHKRNSSWVRLGLSEYVSSAQVSIDGMAYRGHSVLDKLFVCFYIHNEVFYFFAWWIGVNELRIEDKKGEEEIYVHAEKDVHAYVKNDWKEGILKCTGCCVNISSLEMDIMLRSIQDPPVGRWDGRLSF